MRIYNSRLKLTFLSTGRLRPSRMEERLKEKQPSEGKDLGLMLNTDMISSAKHTTNDLIYKRTVNSTLGGLFTVVLHYELPIGREHPSQDTMNKYKHASAPSVRPYMDQS